MSERATFAIVTLLLFGVAATADAGRHANIGRVNRGNAHFRMSHRDVDLVRPTLGADADAAGVLRVTTSRNGEKAVLRLRHLDPHTRYEVRDAETDEALGSVRTSGRGKAKIKVRRRVFAAGKRASFDVPDRLEVVRMDDDRRVLMGATDGSAVAELDELPSFGFAHYAGAGDWHGAVDMLSFADRDTQRFGLTLSRLPGESDDRGEVYDFVRGTTTSTALPLGVDSVADLSRRAFRVLAEDGSVLLRGVLPDLEQPEMHMPPVVGMPGMGDGPFADWPMHDRDSDHDAPAKMGGMGGMGMGRHRDGTGGWTDPGGTPDLDFEPPGLDLEHMTGESCDELFDFMPPEFIPFPQPQRESSRLRLQIADDDGNLTDVGNLDLLVLPAIDGHDVDGHDVDGHDVDGHDVDGHDVDWRRWDCPGDDDHHDTGVGDGDHEDAHVTGHSAHE